MRESHNLIKKVTDIRELDEPEERFAYTTSAVDDDDTESEMHLRDYWRSVVKYRALIVGITLLGTVLAAVYMARKPDIYDAEARVQVDLENNPALGSSKTGSVIVSNQVNDPAYFNTQLQILTGSGLLRRVVKTLDLEHNPDFLRSKAAPNYSGTWQNLRRMVGLGGKDEDADNTQATEDVMLNRPVVPATSREDLAETKRLAPYVRALQGGLRVEPVKETRLQIKETRLIDISFSHSDPQLAAKIVNAITDIFVQANLERKTETNASAGDFLQKRVADLQGQIRNGEERLINYAKNHQILSLDASQNTVVERLAGLNRQLLEAENERKLAEAAHRAHLAPGAADALAEDSDRQTGGREKLAELRQRRAQLLVENTEEWPEVKEVNQQIAVLERQTDDSRQQIAATVVTNLETRYRQALAREQAVREAFEQQRSETLAQNEAAITYRIIQQEIETNKSLLDGLLQRSKENDVVLNGTPNNIHVVDHALLPDSPTGPKRMRGVMVAFIFCLGIGIGFALFLEYLDNSIRSIDDIERVLHLPAIAAIPEIGGTRRLRGAPTLPKRGGKSHHALLLGDELHPQLAEAYRHLRTSVLLSTAGRPPKTLLVASSEPNEGKTTTAVNIALSLAQTGAKVLIIDADMRRPCLQSIFNLSNEHGLTNLLSSEMNEYDVLTAIEQHEPSGLYVLPAGPVPPNPAELLGSEYLRQLIGILESSFKYIVIDSPPITPFTDSVLIAPVVDGVLLVVQSGKSSRDLVRRAQKVLHDVGARIIGVVLNSVNLRSNDYYYTDGYYRPDTDARQQIAGTRG